MYEIAEGNKIENFLDGFAVSINILEIKKEEINEDLDSLFGFGIIRMSLHGNWEIWEIYLLQNLNIRYRTEL